MPKLEPPPDADTTREPVTTTTTTTTRESGESASTTREADLVHELHVHQIELEVQNRELREAQSLLEESRGRYADLYDFAPVGYCTLDADGVVEEINLTAAAMLSRERRRLLGRRLAELLPPAAARAVSEHLSRCRDGEPRVETEVQLASGTFVQVVSVPDAQIRAPGVPALHRTTFTDVTTQRRAHETLRWLGDASARLGASLDEPELLETIVELAVPFLAEECAIELVIEGAGGADAGPATLRAASRRWPDAGGVAAGRSDTPARDHEQLFIGLHAARARALASGETQRLSEPVRDDSGTTRARAAMVVPLAAREQTFGALVLVAAAHRGPYAPADQHAAEDFARRAAMALSHARLYREARRAAETAQRESARAEAANRAKDEFLATISHELRSPLTAILGWVRMLRGGGLKGEDAARALETVERNARAQAQLIADLLDTARIMTGKVVIERMPVDLAAEIESAIDSARPAADARGVTLETFDPSTSAVIDGDPDRMLQVVANLLSNAVKFTPRGGRVRVTLRADEPAAFELTVEDSGVGIEPDFLPHVFEPFRQGAAGTTRKHGGLGLGLAIVRHLVERHGGTVEAHSDGAGCGTTMRVRLPRSAQPHQAVRASAAMQAELLAPDALHGVRALIVDDDADARALLRAVLEAAGAEVTTAGSAADAFATFRRAPPDVLVSDIGMPGEDGCALLRRIRALPRSAGGHIPALAVTAYASADDRANALLAGYAQYLTKPVDPGDLVAAVAILAAPLLGN